MDHGQVRLGLVWIATERQCLMAVSNLGKAGIAGPSICAQRGTERDVVLDKADKLRGTPVGHDTQPQSSRIDAASVLFAVIVTRSDLNSADHDRFVMGAAPLATRLAADHAFVDFDRMLATDCITLGANHAGAELVEYLKSCFITR